MSQENQNWDLRIGLGTASFIPQYGLRHTTRAEEPAKVLEQAIYDGVRYFDTAPVYQDAETFLGKLGLERSRYQVVTKISAALLGDDTKAFAEVESSKQRLGGKLDGLLIHNATSKQIQEKYISEMMKKIQNRFEIPSIGVSTYGVEDAIAANASGWCQIVQFEASVLNSSVIQKLAALPKESVQWVCRSVLTQGLLAGVTPKLSHPRLDAALKTFFGYAKDWGYSPVSLAIRYVLGYPQVDHVVMGAASLEEWKWIQEASQREPLDFSQMEKLDELNLSDLDAVHPQKWNS